MLKNKIVENTEYANLSDEEIIDIILSGDSSPANCLVERYTSLVENIARDVYIKGYDYEDILQEGFIGFLEAVKSFKKNSGTTFKEFAYFCIKKNIYDALRLITRKKRQAQLEAISLDSELDQNSKVKVIESIVNKGNINPEEVVVLKYLVQNIVVILSPLERKVLKLSLEGQDIKTLAKILNKDVKSIGNTLQRARNKIKKYLLSEIKG